MAINAILFDIDGTLVDSNEQHVPAWEEAFGRVGAMFDQQVIHDQIGKGSDMLVPKLLPDTDQAAQEDLGEAHGEVFKSKFLGGVRPLPGGRDLLVRADSAGQNMVLASSASKGELEHYLDLLDVRDLIAATTSADDVEDTKAAPDFFATALKKVAPLAAENVIVVGDTRCDMKPRASAASRPLACARANLRTKRCGRQAPSRSMTALLRSLPNTISRRSDADESVGQHRLTGSHGGARDRYRLTRAVAPPARRSSGDRAHANVQLSLRRVQPEAKRGARRL